MLLEVNKLLYYIDPHSKNINNKKEPIAKSIGMLNDKLPNNSDWFIENLPNREIEKKKKPRMDTTIPIREKYFLNG